MSALGTFERSGSSTLILSALGSRSIRSKLVPLTPNRAISASKCHRRPISPTRRQLSSAVRPHMDNLFIGALVRASRCKEHSADHGALRKRVCNGSQLSVCPWRRNNSLAVGSLRALQPGAAGHQESLAGHFDLSSDDLKALVDIYSRSSGAKATLSARILQENLFIPVAPVEASLHYAAWPAENEDQLLTIKRLLDTLNDDSATHDAIYQYYQALPGPRIPYLSDEARWLLLHRMSVTKRKDETSMLRYLSIIDDVRAAGMTLTSSEWNSAVAFAGRCFARISSAEVESALHIWKEMETKAGVKGNNVTFNILFDIATKAGKFVLAEMVLKEMQARGLELSRFTHVGLIYYYGLKGDGDGVRKAYVNLVESGEIVDTVVLNCVIASLLRAGEAAAAEQVYERMKAMHFRQTRRRLPPRDWRSSRGLGRSLQRAAKLFKDMPKHLEDIQRNTSIAPDLATLRSLISYHCVHTGEYDLVVGWLDEMQLFEVPLNGSIFIALLKGFAIHGGVRYTSWTRTRLETVWTAYHRALEESLADVYVGKWIIIWAIRAYGKCAGKERALEVWDHIKDMWSPTEEELHVVNNVLRDVLVT